MAFSATGRRSWQSSGTWIQQCIYLGPQKTPKHKDPNMVYMYIYIEYMVYYLWYIVCSIWYIKIRILQTIVSLYWCLEPECEILMFRWSLAPLLSGVSRDLQSTHVCKRTERSAISTLQCACGSEQNPKGPRTQYLKFLVEKPHTFHEFLGSEHQIWGHLDPLGDGVQASQPSLPSTEPESPITNIAVLSHKHSSGSPRNPQSKLRRSDFVLWVGISIPCPTGSPSCALHYLRASSTYSLPERTWTFCEDSNRAHNVTPM